jgi:hypothetical protein
MQFEGTVSAGDIATLAGILIAVVTFAIQNRRELAVQKIELYHRLETGSIELFKFEAAHGAILAPFLESTRNPAGASPGEDDLRIKRKFYEQTMNLFEMAARFRKKNIIEPEVYGSWVIWYYDTLNQWGFREEWPDLRQNYTSEPRAIFDRFVAEYDANENDTARKRRFFKHVADITSCPVIRRWLDDLDEEAKRFRFAPA